MFGMGAAGHAARVRAPVGHGGAVVTSTHLYVCINNLLSMLLYLSTVDTIIIIIILEFTCFFSRQVTANVVLAFSVKAMGMEMIPS